MDVTWPVGGIEFEWDAAKASTNFEKHGVTFFEATEVFLDPLARFDEDDDVDDESRFIVTGTSYSQRLLLVVHTERGVRVRIISARQPTARERRVYEHR